MNFCSSYPHSSAWKSGILTTSALTLDLIQDVWPLVTQANLVVAQSCQGPQAVSFALSHRVSAQQVSTSFSPSNPFVFFIFLIMLVASQLLQPPVPLDNTQDAWCVKGRQRNYVTRSQKGKYVVDQMWVITLILITYAIKIMQSIHITFSLTNHSLCAKRSGCGTSVELQWALSDTALSSRSVLKKIWSGAPQMTSIMTTVISACLLILVQLEVRDTAPANPYKYHPVSCMTSYGYCSNCFGLFLLWIQEISHVIIYSILEIVLGAQSVRIPLQENSVNRESWSPVLKWVALMVLICFRILNS